MTAGVCQPSAGGVSKRWIPWVHLPLSLDNWWAPGSVEDPVSKTKTESHRWRYLILTSGIHMGKHTCVHALTSTCTHNHMNRYTITTNITHAHMSSIRSREYEQVDLFLDFNLFWGFYACMYAYNMFWSNPQPLFPSSPTLPLPISHHFSSQFHMPSFSKPISYLNLNITKVMSDMETNSVKVSCAPIRTILRSLWILRAWRKINKLLKVP